MMNEPGPIRIIQTTIDRLIDLRHATLRQGLPRESAYFAGDESPDAVHIAAMLEEVVVGCASFHLNTWESRPAYQLRGMATADSIRRRGVGRAMLLFAEDLLKQEGATRQLWCNARVPAVPFYESMGWTVVSEVFDIPTAGPHVRMTKTVGM